MEEGHFSTVVGAESGLETFKEVIISAVVFELNEQKWKARDRSVIGRLQCLGRRFFKNAGEGGELE